MYTMKHARKWLPGFIWAIELYQDSEDKTDRSIARGLLRKMVNKYSDRPAQMASESAIKLAKLHNKDLFQMRWSHRNQCGKINGKPALLWEHTTPNSKLCDKLLACKRTDQVLEELVNYSGVCWISRAEDDALNAAGFRTKRPGGWKKCYESVGIKVILKQ